MRFAKSSLMGMMVSGALAMSLARNARNDAITGSAPLATGLATETSIRPGAITWALTSPANSGWLLKRALSKRNPREFPVRVCLPRYSVPMGFSKARIGLGLVVGMVNLKLMLAHLCLRKIFALWKID